MDVLVVCTGNICRSPLIAAMLAHAVPGLCVASAGTHAVVGAPAAALTEAVLTEAVLAERGLSAGGHTARQLTAAMVGDARLVLTATRAHRTYAVQLDASAADSAFTVKELARLVAPAGLRPGAGLDALLAGAVARLAHDPGDDGYGDDDLADPVGLPLEAYERCARESELALAPLVLALAPRVAATDGW